jgi:hypothetical protein
MNKKLRIEGFTGAAKADCNPGKRGAYYVSECKD